MPIQIIDNFELNVQKPIDNRFVVGGTSSFYNTRFAIVNPYNGLRIWDLNDNQPYVYNGSTWSSEASLTTLQGTGTANYLPKFNTSNSVENSVVYQNSGNIIIGTTSGSPSDRLVVDGNIRANSGYYYYGSGLYLTSLNATEITTGTLNLARLSISSSSSGWIMSRNASTATWTNPTQLTVGTASALATTRTLWGQNFNGTANVTGNININGNVLNVYTLQFRNNALPTPGTLNVNWLGASNVSSTLNIPGFSGGLSPTRTMALLEQQQTFTKVNTFTDHTNLDTVQVAGTSSFFDKMRVFVTETINFAPPIGPVSIIANPLNVLWGGISIGATTSNGSPYIRVDGGYTWFGDNDSGMFRASTGGSTMSSIRFLNDNRIQMILGNNISPTYSTSVEQYTTPGIAMMSVLDVFSLVNFDSATWGAGTPRFVWLTNSPWSASILASSLPYTFVPDGSSGPGVAAAAAGINATNYDRLVSVYTGGRVSCYLHLETNNGSGNYYITQLIYKDCQYTMIIPAGRRWKLCAYKNLASTSITVSGNPYAIPPDVSPSDDIQVFIYKYGMS